MKCLFSVLAYAALTLPVEFAQPEWVLIGSYENHPPYSTNIYARLIETRWDFNASSNIIIFQINLEGKDVGAMEFEAICRTGYFRWEAKIQVPTTDSRFFSSGAEIHIQKAKEKARTLFC